MNEEYKQNLSIEQWAIPYILEGNPNSLNRLLYKYIVKEFAVDHWFKEYVEKSCPYLWSFDSKLYQFKAKFIMNNLENLLSDEDKAKIKAAKEMLERERRGNPNWRDHKIGAHL